MDEPINAGSPYSRHPDSAGADAERWDNADVLGGGCLKTRNGKLASAGGALALIAVACVAVHAHHAAPSARSSPGGNHCPSGYRCFTDASAFVAALAATCDAACVKAGFPWPGAKPANLYLRGGVISGHLLLVAPHVNVTMTDTTIKDHTVSCCCCPMLRARLCVLAADASITGLGRLRRAHEYPGQRDRHRVHLLRWHK